MNVIKELGWQWEPRKMKKMSSTKRFQKQIKWGESQDYGAFFFSHEQIGIGKNHSSSHGGTQDLVYMRVHDEGAMFEDEIEYYAHYIGWWAVCGQQVLVFFHEVNHCCYAFFVWNVGYRDVTSAVTKMALGGRGGTFSMRLRNCFVSLTCDGRLLDRGWIKWVTQAERWSVGPSHLEKIGRRGQPGL